MTFTPAGSWQVIDPAFGDTTLTTTRAGDLMLAEVVASPASVYCTGITGGGCTWTQITPAVQGTVNDWSGVVFAGKVVTAGTAACTLSFNGTYAVEHARFQEFTVTSGSWALDMWGRIDNAGTPDWAALTAATSGELYYGYAHNPGDAAAGSTPGFTYIIDGDGNGLGYDPACGPGTVQMVWGDSGQAFGIMVLMKEAGTPPPPTRPGLLAASFP